MDDPLARMKEAMGLTHIRARIANPARPGRTTSLRLLVDSGALYSVVPAATLRRLGIQPHGVRRFILADGTEIRRRIGDAVFLINGQRGASPVIFGEKGDAALLGTVSLESLGLILDPMKRMLRRLPMVLGSARLKFSGAGLWVVGQGFSPLFSVPSTVILPARACAPNARLIDWGTSM